MCVCVCERERERERESFLWKISNIITSKNNKETLSCDLLIITYIYLSIFFVLFFIAGHWTSFLNIVQNSFSIGVCPRVTWDLTIKKFLFQVLSL